MLFHSSEFAVLVAAVFVIYWLVLNGRRQSQNLLLLVASYVFYGWWDWRFLGLIIASSTIDFLVGRKLGRSVGSERQISVGGQGPETDSDASMLQRVATQNASRRKLWLSISIGANIGLLGFFKYFDFFADSAAALAGKLGLTLDPITLNVILPVGISFYTFQTLSYTIEVYRGKIQPTSSVLSFFAFVAFFPQLVAGPIERASRLLPQFERERTFSYSASVEGLRQALWGLFKKVVIADSCGVFVDRVFADYGSMSSLDLALGLILFAIQIYADFSGYSDVAIGVARLFGFELMTNFRYPYFARDVGEFWRRWHISLSTWFRDYVYIPLGGNRVTKGRLAINIIIVFVVSGLWHGANWTFVVWGFIHSLLFLPLILTDSHRRNVGPIAPDRMFPKPGEAIRIMSTFMATGLAWVFFRAPSLADALLYLERMFSGSGGFGTEVGTAVPVSMMLGLLVVDWINRDKPHPLADLRLAPTLRWPLYVLLTIATLSFAAENQTPFIYFQF